MKKPVLETISELAATGVGTIERILLKIAISQGRFPDPAYSKFFRYKSDGSKRWILNPCPELKDLQRKIKAALLDPFPPSRFAHGWTAGRSPLTEAMTHMGMNPKYGLSWDIEKCYPSTNIASATEVYWHLTKRFYEEDDYIDYDALAENLAVISTICYFDHQIPVLPTGAPTSSGIINVRLRRFDSELNSRFADVLGHREFVYTRYGDDLTLTSPHPLKTREKALTLAVSSLLAEYDYRTNSNKTRVMQAGNSWPPLEVSGLILDVKNGRLLISDTRLKKLEARVARYLMQRERDDEELRSLRANLGWVAKVYGGKLPGRVETHLVQTLRDESFHQDREAKQRFWELTVRNRFSQIAYGLAGAECYADWVPHQVFDY